MASRVKEDEKNERIIRGLLKQQENRRCINCNSLGPQYVCTNFWTFVCTNCSGIHREFTHRVKSVSMAKFTSQEVGALQEGGNQRAKEIYFKEWDPQRNSFPDGSNVERLRDFIKHVYVDRRYSGERSSDKPPRGKMGDKEEFYENRRTDGYQGGSRSPPYEDTYERRYNERSSPGARNDDRNPRYGYDERRSPGYDQESRQYGDYRKSPARPEVINDWRREDRFGNGRKPEDRRISDGDPKLEGRSPERPKDTGSSSPPVVRPVREILGENAIPLRIIEPPKANGNRTTDGPQTQRTASSSSLGSTIGNPHEVKLENTGSLIDFDADPEPPVIAPVTQVQQTTVTQTFVQPTSSTNDNNWASFDFSPQTKVPQAPSNSNTLDSVFSQLSVPASVPTGGASVGGGQIPAPVANNMNLASLGGNPHVPFPGQIPFGAGARAAVPVSNFATMPPTGALAAASGITPIMPGSTGSALIGVNNAGQWPNVQHQQNSLFSGAGGQSTAQQFVPSVGVSNNQQWNFAPSHSLQGPSSTATVQIPQAVSQSVQDSASTGAPQPLPTETKIRGRKELPADLFTATYPTYPAAVAGWQTGPPRGMGFTMQYNTAVPMSSFPQSSRSMNPFDLGGETTPVQNQTFPSVASLQSALPNMPPPSGLLRTSSLGTPSSAWLPQQSLPYASVMPSQSLPYPAAVPQRAYVGAQLPSNLPPSSHQIGGIRSEASFGFVNTDQQMSGRFSAPTTPQPFSSAGGNPFG